MVVWYFLVDLVCEAGRLGDLCLEFLGNLVGDQVDLPSAGDDQPH